MAERSGVCPFASVASMFAPADKEAERDLCCRFGMLQEEVTFLANQTRLQQPYRQPMFELDGRGTGEQTLLSKCDLWHLIEEWTRPQRARLHRLQRESKRRQHLLVPEHMHPSTRLLLLRPRYPVGLPWIEENQPFHCCSAPR